MTFSTSGTNARKSLNLEFWDGFCRLLGPRPENQQIGTSGNDCVDFQGQGQDDIKSVPLALILPTSGPSESHQIGAFGIVFLAFLDQVQEFIKSGFLAIIFCRFLGHPGAKARNH